MFDDLRCLGVAIKDVVVGITPRFDISCLGLWLGRILFWGVIGACTLAIGLGPMVGMMYAILVHDLPANFFYFLLLIGSLAWIVLWLFFCFTVGDRYMEIKKGKNQ